MGRANMDNVEYFELDGIRYVSGWSDYTDLNGTVWRNSWVNLVDGMPFDYEYQCRVFSIKDDHALYEDECARCLGRWEKDDD